MGTTKRIRRSGRRLALALSASLMLIAAGAGQALASQTISVSPSSMSFGNRHVGTASSAQTATVTNIGNADLQIGPIVLIAGTQFAKSADGCSSATLAPMGFCTFAITFLPTSAGAKADTVVIPSDDPANPTTSVTLSGTGTAPVIHTDVASLDFPDTATGDQSSAQTVTVTSTGTEALDIGTVVTSTAEFQITTDNCSSASVAPSSGSCTIDVAFVPTSAGVKNANLSIPSDDPATPVKNVALSGNATSRALLIVPGSKSFGAILVGAQSAPQTFAVTSTGTAPVTVSGALVSGADPDQFDVLSNTCSPGPIMLSPSQACEVEIAFAPTSAGAKSATLSLADDAPGSPHTASLTGTATSPSPLDEDPPETILGRGPAKRTHDRTPTFRFASDEEGSTFLCRLDRGPFLPCRSPKTYRKLKPGRHAFKVKATDPAGNQDPTAAVKRFTVLP